MNYLPIGSVVTLQEGSRPVMIYGRKQKTSLQDIAWDYVACLYPEGNLGEEYNIFFNASDINQVLYKGFSTQIDLKMQKHLNLM